MTGAWLGTPMPGETRETGLRTGREVNGSGAAGRGVGVLHVDCDTCVVRGLACGECVISVLLGPVDATGGRPAGIDQVDFDTDEQAALSALAGSGLVPPLRLVTSVPSPWVDGGFEAGPEGEPGAGPERDFEPPPDDDGWGDGTAQDWA